MSCERGLEFLQDCSDNSFFVRVLSPSAFHWHFQQAHKAFQQGLTLPGISCLLNGIEASIRVTLTELNGGDLTGDQGRMMSNALLLHARSNGLPIELLKLGESDFEDRLNNGGSRRPVKLVRWRNALCHGNIADFWGDAGEEGGVFFTPECLNKPAEMLVEASIDWAMELAEFRHIREIGAKPPRDLPRPSNPIATPSNLC